MKKLLDRIARLEKISTELEPDQIKRKKFNDEINAFAEEFIKSLVIRPAYTKGNANNEKL